MQVVRLASQGRGIRTMHALKCMAQQEQVCVFVQGCGGGVKMVGGVAMGMGGGVEGGFRIRPDGLSGMTKDGSLRHGQRAAYCPSSRHYGSALRSTRNDEGRG